MPACPWPSVETPTVTPTVLAARNPSAMRPWVPGSGIRAAHGRARTSPRTSTDQPRTAAKRPRTGPVGAVTMPARRRRRPRHRGLPRRRRCRGPRRCAGWQRPPAVDAVRVDLEQDRDAVPGAAGDLGGGRPGVQPQRHRSVPEVVGRRPSGGLYWAEVSAALLQQTRNVSRCSPRCPSCRAAFRSISAWAGADDDPNCTLGPTAGFPARACGPPRRVPWRPAVSCGPVPGFSREACRPARGRARSPCGDGSGARAAGRAVPDRAGRRAVKPVTSTEWPACIFGSGKDV